MFNEKEIEKSFNTLTKDHTLTTLKNEDDYLHFRYRKGECPEFSFEIMVFSNYVAYVGDMGSFTFKFSLSQFNKEKVNTSYWAEKVIASSEPPLEYDLDEIEKEFFKRIKEEEITDDQKHLDSLRAIFYSVHNCGRDSSEIKLCTLLDGLADDPFWNQIFDGEALFEEETYRFIWACFAIQYVARKHYTKVD